MNRQYRSDSVKQTAKIAQELAAELTGGEIIAFRGGLGAGKTTFTAALASALNCTEPVSSPTFTLMNTYHGRLTLHHFDLYRIGDEESLYHVGFYDAAGCPGTVTLIEWSENVEAFLPPTDYVIDISVQPDGSRQFTFRRKGEDFSC